MSRPKILFLAANPADTSLLELDEEVAQIDAAIGADRSFDWDTQRAVRRAEVKQLLAQHRPMIVHFSGHGETHGLRLLNDKGLSSLLSGKALRRTFDAAGALPRLVVLNACHTDEHAHALSAHVDCVIGTTGAILDKAARAFSEVFYRELAKKSVRDAFDAAREALRSAGAAGTQDASRDVSIAQPPPTSRADLFTLYERAGVHAERVILASPPATPAKVPPGLDPAEMLVGRERELAALSDALYGPGGIIALWGLPGVGKSALARACAWQQIQEGRQVLWISGRAGSSDTSGDRLANIDDAVAGGATLYCDDVEPGAVLDGVLELAARGRVIITTRDQLLAEEHIAVSVPPLSKQAAVRFLLERTGQHDAESAGRIAALVGELPLALVQVAGLVGETAATLQAACEWLESAPASGHLDTRAFDLIYDRLADRPETRTLLQVLGIFGLDRIARHLLPAFASAIMGTNGSDERALDGPLAALRRHSLITVTPEAISMPWAVQQMVARRVTPAERTVLSRNGLTFAWAQVANRHDARDDELQDLAALVIRSIDPDMIAAEGSPERECFGAMFASATYRLGRFVDDERQDPRRALQLFRQSAREQENSGYVNGVGDFNLVLRHMAWTSARIREPDWLSLCERAIDLARRALTPEELTSTLNDAGTAAHAAGEHERAVTFFRELLEHTSDEERGTVHHANTLDNLGKLEHSLSHHAEGIRAQDLRESAIRHTWEAMDLRIRIGDTAEKALGAHNLADVLTCAYAFDPHHTRAALGLLRCARDVWSATEPAWSDELASTTVNIVELGNSLGDASDELDEVKRLLGARLEYSPSRLTPNTFRLAGVVRDQSARREKWDDVARAVFLMLDVHPHLDGREEEKRENIADLLTWLHIAAERGAVEDSEYASRVAAHPSITFLDRVASLREELGLRPREGI